MFVWLWLLIYGILSATASYDELAMSMPDKHEIDHLGIETALEDEIQYHKTDPGLSDNINTDIDSNVNLRRVYQHSNTERFIDFIQNVIEILNQYTDTDLEHFFEIFNDEVRKYHYNGCKFYELTDNDAFKKFIARQFEEIRNKQASDLRLRMEKITRQIEEASSNPHEKELIDFINSLYRQDSIEKFNKFLTKMKNYRLRIETDSDLVKIVRDGIRSLIFNHYTKLDYNTRAALKFKLDQYWEHMTAVPVLRAELNAKEFQLLEHGNNHVGKFYFKKQNRSSTKPQTHIKNIKFRTLYPKFVMEWKILGSPPEKLQTSASHRSTTELNLYKAGNIFTRRRTRQTETDDFEFIKESMVQNIKHSTKDILRQKQSNNEYKNDDNLNENYSNDEDNSNLMPTVDNKAYGTETATYLSLYVDHTHSSTTKHFQVTEAKRVQSSHRHRRPSPVKDADGENKRESVATLYTIDMPDLTTNEPEVVTSRHTKDKLKHIKSKHKSKSKDRFDRTHLNFRRQQSDKFMHTSSNEDVSIDDKGLFVEEVEKDDGTLAYKRSYNDNLPANTVLIDADIFARLQELENQLDDVKSLAKNDTEMVKQLKSKISQDKEITSNQFILAKIVPCTQDGKEIKKHLSKDLHSPQDYTSNKLKPNDNYAKGRNQISKHQFDTRRLELPNHERLYDHDIRMHDENYGEPIDTSLHANWSGEEMPNLDEFHHTRYNDKLPNFDSNQELYMNSRRAMINKVEEIKNKYNGANKNMGKNEGKDHIRTQSKIDFEKEYIPDKDTFNRNMVTLENFLDTNKNLEYDYTTDSNMLTVEKNDNLDHIDSNDMRTNIRSRKLLAKDDKNLAESYTALIEHSSKASKASLMIEDKHNVPKYKNNNQIILKVDDDKATDTQKYKYMDSKSDTDKHKKVINTVEKYTLSNIPINNISYNHIETKNNSIKTTYKGLTSNLTQNKRKVDSLLRNQNITSNNNLDFSHNNTNSTRNLSDNESEMQSLNFYLMRVSGDNKSKTDTDTKLNVGIWSSPKFLRNNSTSNGNLNNKSLSETRLKSAKNISKNNSVIDKLLFNNYLGNKVENKFKFNESKENIIGDTFINKARQKRNVKPMSQKPPNADLYLGFVDDKDIDWDNINIHNMFNEMNAKIRMNSPTIITPKIKISMPRRRMLALAPSKQKIQTTKQETTSTTLTIPVDLSKFNPLLPNNVMYPRRRVMQPIDLKYNLNHNRNNIFGRRNNNLPLAPPAGKTIPIKSEEAFDINVRSRLNVRNRAMTTKPSRYYKRIADMESLFKQLGSPPAPQEIIQDVLGKSIQPIASGRRNFDAKVTPTPIRKLTVDENILADPFLSDMESALGTKLPPESTTWEPLL